MVALPDPSVITVFPDRSDDDGKMELPDSRLVPLTVKVPVASTVPFCPPIVVPLMLNVDPIRKEVPDEMVVPERIDAVPASANVPLVRPVMW